MNFKKILATLAGDRSEREMLTVPVFTLSTILFPGSTLSLRVFEQRYLELVKASLRERVPFGIALIEAGAEVGAPAVPAPVGTLARIDDWDMREQGVLQLRVSGLMRFRIAASRTTTTGLLVADAHLVLDDAPVATPDLTACSQVLHKIMTALGMPADADRYQDAFWVGMRLTELLPLGNAIKQKMLELTDASMRLGILHRVLREQRLIEA